MIDFSLTDEQLAHQRVARDFAETQMKPYAAELDLRQDASFDWSIVRRLAHDNMLGLLVPEEYGGINVDYTTGAVIAEELGAGCAGMSAVAGATWLACISIILVGTEEQKTKYLPRITNPEGNLAALAVTEPEAGSDVAAIKTMARKEGDHYILNGSKSFITNAGLADFYVVFATTDPSRKHGGLNAFIVDGDSQGLKLGSIEDKMGLRASQTGDLTFTDAAVPEENLLGEESAGFLILMQTLDASRPCFAAVSVGLARAAFEVALKYAKSRQQYGRPIISNQGVSFLLADMATRIHAARLLTWRSCYMIQSCQDATQAASMAKVFSSETAEWVCSKAMLLLGANGYTRKWPVEKYLRDAKAMSIYEGTDQIQRIIISSQF